MDVEHLRDVNIIYSSVPNIPFFGVVAGGDDLSVERWILIPNVIYVRRYETGL